MVYSSDFENEEENDLTALFRQLGYRIEFHILSTTDYKDECAKIPHDALIWLSYDLLDDENKDDNHVSMAPARHVERMFRKVAGCSSQYQEICSRKSLMHRKFAEARISFPGNVHISSSDQLAHDRHMLEEEIEKMGAPYFVKVDAGYDSLGLSSACIQNTVSGILDQAKLLLDEYGPVVVQHYVGGREFTVAVAGTESFGVCERIFGEGELISPSGGAKGWARLDEREPLCAKIQKIALDAFLAVGGNSYGRVDVRCDVDNKPYVLEVNPDCSIAPNSYFELSLGYLGHTRQEVVGRLLEAASAC